MIYLFILLHYFPNSVPSLHIFHHTLHPIFPPESFLLCFPAEMSRHLRISTIVCYNKTHIEAKEEIWVTKEAGTKGEYGCKPQTHPTKKPKPRNWDSGLILCRTKWTISGNTSKFSLQKIIKTVYSLGLRQWRTQKASPYILVLEITNK